MEFAITVKIRDAIKLLPIHNPTPATNADGGVRAAADVVELAGLWT